MALKMGQAPENMDDLAFSGDQNEPLDPTAEDPQDNAVPERPRFAPRGNPGRSYAPQGRGGGYARASAPRGGARRGGQHGQSKYQRVTGMWEQQNGGFRGKTTEPIQVETEMGPVDIPAGVVFYLFPNDYARGGQDPQFNLSFSKEAPQQRGGGYGGRGGYGRR